MWINRKDKLLGKKAILVIGPAGAIFKEQTFQTLSRGIFEISKGTQYAIIWVKPINRLNISHWNPQHGRRLGH